METQIVRNSFTKIPTAKNFFVGESIENPLELDSGRYLGRGEWRYGNIARPLMVRSCHDALVKCLNEERGEYGILLIRRIAEPAYDLFWSLGGFFDRFVKTKKSLADRIKHESGLDVDEESYVGLGHIRAMWEKTPYQLGIEQPLPKEVVEQIGDTEENQRMWNIFLQYMEKDLPRGIDDTGLLFYVESNGGELNLDKLHDRPLIVTPEMYTPNFREELHPYMQEGMDIAIQLLDPAQHNNLINFI